MAEQDGEVGEKRTLQGLHILQKLLEISRILVLEAARIFHDEANGPFDCWNELPTEVGVILSHGEVVEQISPHTRCAGCNGHVLPTSESWPTDKLRPVVCPPQNGKMGL